MQTCELSFAWEIGCSGYEHPPLGGKQALGSLCVLSGRYPPVLNPHYNAGPDEGLLLSGLSVPVFSSAN